MEELEKERSSFLLMFVSSFLEKTPWTLLFFFQLILLLALVALRMKRVEQDYTLHTFNLKLSKERIVNKELRAQKAFLMSSNYLGKLAQKFELDLPSENQIILIPYLNKEKKKRSLHD